MKHNAKRILSIVLCLLMCVSMLTAIVLPAAATSGEAPAIADPYAVISGTEDENGVITPDNAFFYNLAWGTTGPADMDPTTKEFDYTNGGEELGWGDGKTYHLTFGVNAFGQVNNTTWRDNINNYGTKWAAGNASRDLVLVLAPGEYGGLGYPKPTAMGGVTDPTQDQVLNVYLLGPQAGKSPVNADKSTKANAKAIQNGRNVTSGGTNVAGGTEAVFNNLFPLIANSNYTIDGIAGKGTFSFFVRADVGYNCNLTVKNFYLADKTQGNQQLTSTRSEFFYMDNAKNTLIQFEDSYFNINKAMSGGSTSEYNAILANKIVFDNCVFAEGKTTAKNTSKNTNQFKFVPLPAASATANFLGDYKVAPLYEVKNCAVVDWEAVTIFMFDFGTNYPAYTNTTNALKINITDNKCYDMSTTTGAHGFPIWFNNLNKTKFNSFEAKVTGNLFSYSEEVFGSRTKIEIETIMVSGAKTQAGMDLKMLIKDNVFKAPNHNNNANWDGSSDTNRFGISFYNINNVDNSYVNVDLSGNLFMDNDGNILPLLVYTNAVMPAPLLRGGNINSDIYADDSMQGGVRELMNVTEIEDGVAAYSFIQTRAQTRYRNFDYFTGALTLLLKDGKEYDADTLIKTSCEDVEFMGIYTEETCENKVDTVNKDTVNGKFAKLQYKTENTTLTVVYTINTPSKLHIVDPNGDYVDEGYEFNGDLYTTENASFYGSIAEAHTAAAAPYMNDILDRTTGLGKTNNMNDLIVLVPGEYDMGELAISKSVAIVGPQWAVSAYGEGALANGRSADAATEAVINGTFVPASAYSFVLDGVAFAGEAEAVNFANVTNTTGATLQYNVVKNCVFANTADAVVDGVHAANDAKVLNVTLKDSAILDRAEITDALIKFRANFANVENIAVFGMDCANEDPASITAISATDADAMRWTAKIDGANVGNIYYSKDIHSGELTEVEGTKVPATCMSTGTVEKTCSICEETITVILPIDKDAHTGNNTEGVGAKDPTCGDLGYTGDTVCECGEIIVKGDDIAATGEHTDGEWVISAPATPTEDGLKEQFCAVCNQKIDEEVLPATGVANVNGVPFRNIKDALAAAEAGQTVALSENVTVDYITVDPGVTLDLNGKTLTADYIIGFSGSVITGEGAIVVDKDKVLLDLNNGGSLPVYNGTSYSFIGVPTQEMKDASGEDTVYYFLPNMAAAHEALLAGAAYSGVKVVVRLSWYKDGNYTAVQNYVYMDSMVQDVINSYAEGNYGKVFTATFAGTEAGADDVSGLKVSAVLVSDTGVEISSDGISFDAPNA